MTEQDQKDTNWKAALRESGALGWAAMGVMIVIILVGALVFGQKSPTTTEAKGTPQSTTR